jgi:hypothetical protein
MGSAPAALIAAALAAATLAAADGALTVSFASRAMKPGELVVVSIDLPPEAAPEPHVSVKAFNHETPAFKSGDHQWRALVGIDLDVKPGTYPIEAWVDQQNTVSNVVVAAKAFRTRTLTVDPRFVSPPANEAARIEQEARLLERTWASSAPTRLWTPFSAPVPQPTNSAFGTRSVFNGTPRNAHGGADFLSPAGTVVAAPSAGRIVVARNLYFSGNTIIIDHGLGLFSMLAHLSEMDVKEGEVVTARQHLGKVGATGRVTGPHLHWAVRAGNARVDPLAVLALLSSP